MSCTVKVKYYNIIRDVTEKNEELIHINVPCSIQYILSKLVNKYGVEFEKYIFTDNGKLKPYIRLVKNGKLITNKDLKGMVEDSDELSIFVAHAGG